MRTLIASLFLLTVIAIGLSHTERPTAHELAERIKAQKQEELTAPQQLAVNTDTLTTDSIVK